MYLCILDYFITSLDNKEVLEGYDVKFECEVIEENTTAIWYKDGKELMSSESHVISTCGKKHCLEIVTADVSDAGIYSVNINNRERCAQLKITGIVLLGILH